MFKNMMKTTAIMSLLAGSLQAADIEVKIVNNTSSDTFTPLLVVAHTSNVALFTVGEAASSALQMMAEGGDTSGLKMGLTGANIVDNPAMGLLKAGESTTAMLSTTTENNSLSIVAMILPTNDGFIALNNWRIPDKSGVYTVQLHAFDAGTEANNEIINGAGMPGQAGIPADPSGNAGMGASGVMAEVEGFVHIHRGILGDTDATGGVSDLDATKHRWLNPIATAIITVK